ncbi:MAG: hypothetical protein DSM106950_26575 [Stigonema ocellatum SAG 48.90 = DSM 106950]|nr:hypothetical protein [Stigonema ocellatum SAG 48.90 = DSM 106950]
MVILKSDAQAHTALERLDLTPLPTEYPSYSQAHHELGRAMPALGFAYALPTLSSTPNPLPG